MVEGIPKRLEAATRSSAALILSDVEKKKEFMTIVERGDYSAIFKK